MGTPFEKVAVDHVNLDIEGGEIVGVIGHTGSGKSTLIQHLNGLLQPTEGRVLINGNDIWADKSKLRQVRFDVGLVFQYPEYQLFEADVLSDVCFGPKNQGLSQEECEARAKEALEMVGFPEKYYRQSPFELSGGQKRRAAIAGILAMHPKVLILDDSTSAVDTATEARIRTMLQEKLPRMTKIIIAQRISSVRHADMIVVLDDGRIKGCGTHEELLKSSRIAQKIYEAQQDEADR